MRAVWLGLACAALLAGCASDGASRPPPGRDGGPVRVLLSADAMLFVGFDTDGDLRTTAAEVEAGLQREFTRADANHDGQIQPLEFQNWSNVALGGMLIGPYRLDFDRNVDNAITREEFDTEIRARMRDYDGNEDGVLTRPDFVRQQNQARPPVEGERRQPSVAPPMP